MPFLIDGHNLVPKIQGLSLEHADDELILLEMLQRFANRAQKEAEVIFDKAVPVQPTRSGRGRVKAFFAPQGKTADDEIQKRLKQLGKAARNWTVVSSDRRVIAEARAAGAKTMKSEEFARLMQAATQHEPAGLPDEQPVDEQELQEWLELFSRKKTGK